MPTTDTQSLRIFVVENDTDTLKYFRMLLEDQGHTVFEASTLSQALAEFPAAKCDVLISDIGLEDGTGWDLLRQLREKQVKAPACAIAMSGFGRNADRLTSEAAGFSHHLLKPFDFEELDEILKGLPAKRE